MIFKDRKSRVLRTVLSLTALALLTGFIYSSPAASQQIKKKKLYITNIKADGVEQSIAKRVREDIALSVFENYGKKYQVLDDEAIRVMYKQAAAILASGNTDSSSLMQIADGLNADEIIYGEVRREDGKIKLVLTNLMRSRRAQSLETKSKVLLLCLESQLDHFAGEAAKRLMNPGYRINRNYAPSFETSVNLKAIKIGKIHGIKDISVMKFQSRDDSIARILGYLKGLVQKGDSSYSSKKYAEAQGHYVAVLEKVRTKLRPEKQRKMTSFISGVQKRIASCIVMDFKEKIDAVDKEVKSSDQANLKKLYALRAGYFNLLRNLSQYERKYPQTRALIRSVQERIDSICSVMEGVHEKQGDLAYREYRFENALKSYSLALGDAMNIRNAATIKQIRKRLTAKQQTARTTGESYLTNRVKLMLDQAEFFNLKDESAEAQQAIMKARSLITASRFSGQEARRAYNTLAGMLHTEPLFAGRRKVVGGIEFVWIEGGSFIMGSDRAWDDEKPAHRVTVSGFWMSRCEITQEQYKKIMGSNPSRFKGSQKPVEQVSWNSAAEFCRIFSAQNRVQARLPYEAEWEFACRAGSRTKYYWGNSMNGAYCWYKKNSGKTTHDVGTKKQNAWGLYDMSGNVEEWCQDFYDARYYRRSPQRDPHGPQRGKRRVVRNGSWGGYGKWADSGYDHRSANRTGYRPNWKSYWAGFRIVMK